MPHAIFSSTIIISITLLLIVIIFKLSGAINDFFNTILFCRQSIIDNLTRRNEELTEKRDLFDAAIKRATYNRTTYSEIPTRIGSYGDCDGLWLCKKEFVTKEGIAKDELNKKTRISY